MTLYESSLLFHSCTDIQTRLFSCFWELLIWMSNTNEISLKEEIATLKGDWTQNEQNDFALFRVKVNQVKAVECVHCSMTRFLPMNTNQIQMLLKKKMYGRKFDFSWLLALLVYIVNNTFCPDSNMQSLLGHSISWVFIFFSLK